MRKQLISSAFVMALTVPMPVAAQSQEGAQKERGVRNRADGTPSVPDSASAEDQGPPASDWTFAVGLMGTYQPRYIGSDEMYSQAAPYLQLDYKGLIGFKPSQTLDRTLGFYYRPLQVGPLRFGLLAMGEILAREENDAKALKGMGDRKRGLFYGLEMNFQTEPLNASLEVLKGSNKAGLVAGLNLNHGFQFNERWGLELGLTGVWGDKDYHAWEFGITPAQALRREAFFQAGSQDLRISDTKPFTPKAGLREVRAEAMLQWRVTDRLMTIAMVQRGRLFQDAADSPLTRSKDQTSFMLGFGYMFSMGSHGH